MEYQKVMLAQGTPLYVLPMPHVETVALGVLVKIGTREEVWPREAGLAHAMEHMAFQGTKEFPEIASLNAYIEAVGGRLNAFTGSELTFFFNCLPKDEAHRGFKALGQQLVFPLFLPERIKTEMPTIIQEIKRADDDPVDFLSDKFEEVLFGSHPLGKRVLGFEDSVSAFNQDNFRVFLQKWYHRSNFVFLAVGNIEAGKAQELFEENFYRCGNGQALVREAVPLVFSPQNLEIQKDVKQAHLMMGTATCPADHRDSLILKVFRTMIAGGMSFPLFEELRSKRGLCYHVQSLVGRGSDISNFVIYVGTDFKKLKEAKDIIFDVINISKSSEKLLQKAKDFYKGGLAMDFESTVNIIKTMVYQIALDGRPKEFKEMIAEVESVTIQEVERAVNRYLAADRMISVTLVPNAK